MSAQGLPEASPPTIGPVQPEEQQREEPKPTTDDGVEDQGALPNAVGHIDSVVDQPRKPQWSTDEGESADHKIRDLAAQEEVAQWAGPTFGAALAASLAAVASAGASIYGILLLRGTLQATRDTLKEARAATAAAEKSVETTTNAAYLQSRSYVTVRHAMVGRWNKSDVAARVEVMVLLVNSGRTPAHDVLVEYDFPANTEESEHYVRRGPALGADQMFTVTAEHTFIRPKEYFLTGRATYTDYTGTAQFTNFSYVFHYGRDRDGDHLQVDDGPNNGS